jgi:hypothetical protein
MPLFYVKYLQSNTAIMITNSRLLTSGQPLLLKIETKFYEIFERVSDCCLSPKEQFFSKITARTSYFRWDYLFIVGILFPNKSQKYEKHWWLKSNKNTEIMQRCMTCLGKNWSCTQCHRRVKQQSLTVSIFKSSGCSDVSKRLLVAQRFIYRICK